MIQGSKEVKEGSTNARAVFVFTIGILVSNLPWLTGDCGSLYKPVYIMYGISLRKANVTAAVIRKYAGLRSQPTMTSTFTVYFIIYEV